MARAFLCVYIYTHTRRYTYQRLVHGPWLTSKLVQSGTDPPLDIPNISRERTIAKKVHGLLDIQDNLESFFPKPYRSRTKSWKSGQMIQSTMRRRKKLTNFMFKVYL